MLRPITAGTLSGLILFGAAWPFESSTALRPRQDSDTPLATDPSAWCETLDPTQEADALAIWEDWGVGYWMTNYLQQGIDPPDDGWPYKLFQAVGNGTDGVQHCGAVGATCEFHDMIDDCKGLASRGYGFHHYIISALTNFQSHLNFVNGEFQTKAIADGFRIDSMVSDFSTPKEYQVASGIAAYVSASLFIAGGAAGSTTLAASKIQSARLAVANARVRRLEKEGDQDAVVKALKEDIAKLEEGLNKGGAVPDFSSVTGALVYLAAPMFALSVNVGVESDGQVLAGQLSSHVQSLFQSAINNLDLIGQLVTGQATDGDYSALPGQIGQHGGYTGVERDYIQEFFSDGKFLLGLTQSTMGPLLETAFDSFTGKLVDTTLQGANFELIADLNLKTQDDCEEWYGAQWRDPYCWRIFRHYENPPKCKYPNGPIDDDGVSTCEWAAATELDYDKIDDYGLKIAEYVDRLVECAEQGNQEVDLLALPIDGSLPVCWYNMPVKAGYLGWTAIGRTGTKQLAQLEDFPPVK